MRLSVFFGAFEVARSPRCFRLCLCAAGTLALLAASSSELSSAPRTAAMRLPESLAAASTRLPFDGFGGRNRGHYTAGAYSGEFTRIESRLAIFDPGYVSNRGTGSFSVSGPGLDGTISGDCAFKQNVVTLRVVTFDSRRFAFVCDIRGGDEAVAAFRLVEPRPESIRARLVARAERVGEAEVGGLAFDIRSVHEYAGTRLKANVPVGYVMSIDAVPVAALELTDVNPTLILGSDLPEDEYAATLVVALALSVLRDPADSALGE